MDAQIFSQEPARLWLPPSMPGKTSSDGYVATWERGKTTSNFAPGLLPRRWHKQQTDSLEEAQCENL